MNNYETINLNDYVQTGEGGTALTYTHKVRPTAFLRMPYSNCRRSSDKRI